MAILAIDTSLGTSVAVIDELGETLSELVNLDRLAHVEVIGDFIARSLLMARIEPAALSEIVIGVGPGPFTGLRVGIAAAKGFASGLGKTLLGVSSLDALALQLYRGEDLSSFHRVRPGEFTTPKRPRKDSANTSLESDTATVSEVLSEIEQVDTVAPAGVIFQPEGHESIHLVTDARRREVFQAHYLGLDHNGLPKRIGELELLAGEAVPASAITADWLSAVSLARYAQTALAAGVELLEPNAIYLRQADVTLSVPKRVS
ncbi:MAG: tRNA (adenosine(37)-N6)-threonylcarbamoyltransferase complex dimerization subunit type 1 TsaB [Microbacteriaceae bacterium]